MVEEVKHISKHRSVAKDTHKSTRTSSSSSKSSQLKLYEKVYNKYIQKLSKNDSMESPKTRSSRKSATKLYRSGTAQSPPPVVLPRRKCPTKTSTSSVRETVKNKQDKKLTDYQKFVKTESKKTKYKKTSPRSRLKSIGQEWSKSRENKSKVRSKVAAK